MERDAFRHLTDTCWDVMVFVIVCDYRECVGPTDLDNPVVEDGNDLLTVRPDDCAARDFEHELISFIRNADHASLVNPSTRAMCGRCSRCITQARPIFCAGIFSATHASQSFW
jgi:hypothetical protein